MSGTGKKAVIQAVSTMAEALDALSSDTDRSLALKLLKTLTAAHLAEDDEDDESEFEDDEDDEDEGEATGNEFETAADLVAAASPTEIDDSILCVAYWLQEVQEESEFTSLAVNRELKDLGVDAGNITVAMNSLIHRQPRPIQQTRKEGNARQARKKFKLTHIGKQRVRALLERNGHG